MVRSWGIIGGLAAVGLCVVVACSSSDDAAQPPAADVEAGSDAPSTPPAEGGVDGGGADAGGVQHAGTRIKLHGIETAEGTFLYDAPFDSKLGSVCYPTRTEDGVLRCIPQVEASITTFADANCTMPLAETSKNRCTKPTFGVRYISSATDRCDTRYAIYNLGAVVDVATVYAKNNGVDCMQYAASVGSDYYAVLAPVPSTDLVTFTETIAPLTTDLGAYVLDGDDGSRIQRSYFEDVKRGKACEPNLGSDGLLHCTPRSKARAGAFSDMGCTTKAADPAECVVAYETFDETTAALFELGHCAPAKIRAFPLGAKRVSRDEFQSDGDGGCSGPITSPRDVYDVGAEIAPSTMPAMAPAPGGGPRIVEGTLVSGGVVAQHLVDRASDTMLGTPCHYATAADGKLRCLPDAVGAFFYTDDKCTLPVGVQTDDCTTTVKYVARTERTACPVEHIHLAGTKLDVATPVYQLTGAGGTDCVLVGGSNSVAYYTLGAEVPAPSFEEGKVVTK